MEMRRVLSYFRPEERWPAGALAAASALTVVTYLFACLVETMEWLGLCRMPLVVWSAVTGIFGYMVVGQGVLAGLALLSPICYVISMRRDMATRACRAAWATLGFVLIVQIAVLGGTPFHFVAFCGKEDQYRTEERSRRELIRLYEDGQDEKKHGEDSDIFSDVARVPPANHCTIRF